MTTVVSHPQARISTGSGLPMRSAIRASHDLGTAGRADNDGRRAARRATPRFRGAHVS